MSTQGPNYTGTASDDSSVGTATWTNPTNAQGAPDGSYATNSPGLTTEDIIKLVIGGTVTGNNKSTSATIPSTLQFVSYGGSADLWGTTPTVAQVNASDFGVVFAATGGGIHSHYLKALNFGFSIPAGATINGILAEVDQWWDSGVALKVDAIRITITYTAAAVVTVPYGQYNGGVAEVHPMQFQAVSTISKFTPLLTLSLSQSIPAMSVQPQMQTERDAPFREVVPHIRGWQPATFLQNPPVSRSSVVPVQQPPTTETVPTLRVQPQPAVAVSLRVKIQEVYGEPTRAPDTVPTITARPAVPAPTFPVCQRVGVADVRPEYAAAVTGRGQGEPKTPRMGRVIPAIDVPIDTVQVSAGACQAKPSVRSRAGQVVGVEMPYRDCVPAVAPICRSPRVELPPRPRGAVFAAEPLPPDWIAPRRGGPSGPQNPPRTQRQASVPIAEERRETMPAVAGCGRPHLATKRNGATAAALVADGGLRDALPTIIGRNWGVAPGSTPAPTAATPPWRLDAGQIFTPGAAAGQTGGQG